MAIILPDIRIIQKWNMALTKTFLYPLGTKTQLPYQELNFDIEQDPQSECIWFYVKF